MQGLIHYKFSDPLNLLYVKFTEPSQVSPAKQAPDESVFHQLQQT